jgi:hypothetical protein
MNDDEVQRQINRNLQLITRYLWLAVFFTALALLVSLLAILGITP